MIETDYGSNLGVVSVCVTFYSLEGAIVFLLSSGEREYTHLIWFAIWAAIFYSQLWKLKSL